MTSVEMPDVPGLDELVLVRFEANGLEKPMSRAKYDLMVASGSEGLEIVAEGDEVPPSVEPGSEVTESMRAEAERLRDGDPAAADTGAPAEPPAQDPPPVEETPATTNRTGRRAGTSGEEQS